MAVLLSNTLRSRTKLVPTKLRGPFARLKVGEARRRLEGEGATAWCGHFHPIVNRDIRAVFERLSTLTCVPGAAVAVVQLIGPQLELAVLLVGRDAARIVVLVADELELAVDSVFAEDEGVEGLGSVAASAFVAHDHVTIAPGESCSRLN